MPTVGDIQRGRDIGNGSGDSYIWIACRQCGHERWVNHRLSQAGKSQVCRSCSARRDWTTGTRSSSIYWADGVKDIKNGHQLGKASDSLHVLVDCPTCKKERWMRWSSFQKNPQMQCRSCSARESILKLPGFKGVRQKKWNQGYLRIWVDPSDPYHPMANQQSHYVMEHRLVMARSLGRFLERHETVHHINGRRDDNRLENLELWSRKHGAGIRQEDAPHCPTCTCSGRSWETILKG